MCFPVFQRKTSSACVDCLTGEVGSGILICVQNQSDPSGMKPLPPYNFEVEVGRGLGECAGPVQQIRVGWPKCPFVHRH